jgi:hypothetical protein
MIWTQAAAGTAAAWVQIMLVLGAATAAVGLQNGTLLENTPTAWKTHSTDIFYRGLRRRNKDWRCNIVWRMSVDVEICDPGITKSVENYASHTYS